MIINRDVSAQPIGFRDAIRIQMKRTPVLSLILVYPFYLGTHSSRITMGQRSGGTKPCGWYSCKWKEKASLFDFSGRKLGACRQSCVCVKVGQNVPRPAPGALRGHRWAPLPSELLPVAVQLFLPQPEWWIKGQVRRMSKENYFMPKSHYNVLWVLRTDTSFLDTQVSSSYEDSCLHRGEHVYKR